MTLQHIMNNDEPFYKPKAEESLGQFPSILKIQDILKTNLQDSPSKELIQRAANILSSFEKTNDLSFYKESLSNQIRSSIQDYLKRATGTQSPVKISGEINVSTEENTSSPINLSFKDLNEQTFGKHRESMETDQNEPKPEISLPKYSSPNKSKRKSSNPVKVPIVIEEPVERFQVTPEHHHSQSSSVPSSPSGDSGVLDLSRSNSVSGSAPITPKKEDDHLFTKTSSPILNQFNNPIFDFIQKHFINNQPAKPNNPFTFGDNREFFLSQANMPYILPKPKDFLGNDQHNTPKLMPLSPCKTQKKSVSLKNLNRSSNPVQRRSNASRKFPCNQCRQEFTSLHSLEEHTISTHGSYRCHICQAQFTQRSNLQRHALKHVGFKPFECTVCKKAYYRKDHLIRHMEIGHPGYDPRTNIKVHLTSSESLEFLNRAAVFANNIQSQINSNILSATTNCSPQHSLDEGSQNLIIDEESQPEKYPLNQPEFLASQDYQNSFDSSSQHPDNLPATAASSPKNEGESSPKGIMHWTSINEQLSKSSNHDLKV